MVRQSIYKVGVPGESNEGFGGVAGLFSLDAMLRVCVGSSQRVLIYTRTFPGLVMDD